MSIQYIQYFIPLTTPDVKMTCSVRSSLHYFKNRPFRDGLWMVGDEGLEPPTPSV
jgi:hypothetical protein